MNKHAKGPWKLHTGMAGRHTARGKFIPTHEVHTIVTADTDLASGKVTREDWSVCGNVSKENAERIVECVNALEGVENPAAVVRLIKAAQRFDWLQEGDHMSGGDLAELKEALAELARSRQ